MSDQPFKIKAWPFVDHVSTATRSQTSFLWPFIYHSREADGTVTFKINPLLLSIHKKPGHHMTLSFLFYSFYLNIVYGQFTTFFLLPLAMFIKVRHDRYWRRIVLLGGALFYGMFTGQYQKMIILPLLHFSKKDHKGSAHEKQIQVVFPLFWRYKSPTNSLLLILPVFWMFSNAKFSILHVWPFFGRQDRKDHYKYRDYSFLYPLFRVRTGEKDSELTIHLFWPIVKYSSKANKKSFRIFPLVWIRQGETEGRGNILFIYWSWRKNQVFRFGLFGLFHVSRDLSGKGDHVVIVLFLLIWIDDGKEHVRCFTWLHCSYYGEDWHRTWIFPLYFYDGHSLDKLLVVPFALLYYKYESAEKNMTLVQIPFVIYKSKDCPHEKHLYMWASGYILLREDLHPTYERVDIILPTLTFIRSYRYNNNETKDVWVSPLFRVLKSVDGQVHRNMTFLLPIFFVNHHKANNTDWRDIWVTPLFRSLHDSSSTSVKRIIFALPLFFVTRETRPNFTDLKVLTIAIFVWKKQTSLLACSPVFGIYRNEDGPAFWLLPFVFVRKQGKEDWDVVIPIVLFCYFNRDDWRLLVLPFATGVSFTKRHYVQAKRTESKTYLVVLYGLFVKVWSPRKMTIWVFLCLYHVVTTQDLVQVDKFTIFCPFLLPPYYIRMGDAKAASTVMLLPFFVKIKADNSLYILPPLIHLRLQNVKEHIVTVFPFFRYSSEHETGAREIRILFFFELALIKYAKEVFKGDQNIHFERIAFHIYPLVFWHKQYLLLHKQPKEKIPVFNRSECDPVDPRTTFTLLGFAAGYGLFSATIDKQYHAIQVYLFLLFHIESEMGSLLAHVEPHNRVRLWAKAESTSDTFSFALFWLIHPRFSLLSYDSSSNDMLARRDVTTFYIALLFYISAENQLTDTSYSNTKTVSFLWIIPSTPLIYRYSYYADGSVYQSLTYVFLLVFVQFYDVIEAKQMMKSMDVALFWFIHKNASLFYYSVEKIFLSKANGEKELEDHVVDDESRFDDDTRLTLAEKPVFEEQPSYTNIWSYIPILYYIDRNEQTHLTKFSMFWFIVRQASFIRYSKETGKEVKFVLFPLYKYGRRSGEWSKWCLFPLVPIKYSYEACILVREKIVRRKGTLGTGTAEDKSQREEDIDIRFLYRVVRYQIKDSNTTFEWNPFYNSERDKQTDYSSWDCIGGCVGQRKVRNRDKECRCCCFFYF